jgi:formylglycine-generating enzyme required for sulfatase activity
LYFRSFHTGKNDLYRVRFLRPGAPPPAVAPFDAATARKHQEAWAAHLGKPLEIENSIGMKFSFIPPGEFMMGSTEEEVEQLLKEAKERQEPQWYIDRIPSESPRHRVRITGPFYLGLHEVTQAEYQQVMGVNPSAFSAEGKEAGKEAGKVAGLDTSRHPVEMVSWDEANAFRERLSAMPEERTSGRVYVLPTEAQWEYACRAGTTRKWSCGDDEVVLRDHAWYSRNSGRRTHGVGEWKPNAFGLFDMHGNVWEWCADWYGSDSYAASLVDDPQGPASGSDHVFRGGCWDYSAGHCRSAGRYGITPDFRYSDRGFRLALVPAAESSK